MFKATKKSKLNSLFGIMFKYRRSQMSYQILVKYGQWPNDAVPVSYLVLLKGRNSVRHMKKLVWEDFTAHQRNKGHIVQLINLSVNYIGVQEQYEMKHTWYQSM